MVDLDEVYVAHQRQHCSGNVDTTFNVSYAPIFVSIPQLIEKTKQILIETYRKKEGVYFDFPYESWV